MYKNFGFTLVEVLATIVILAVISLITTPVVLNVIEKSEENSASISAKAYVVDINNSILLLMDSGKSIESGQYSIDEDGNICITDEYDSSSNTCSSEYKIEIETDGTIPSSGTVVIGKYMSVYSYDMIINDISVSDVIREDDDTTEEETTPEKLYLFKYGEQYTDITGGWSVNVYQSSGKATIADDYLYIGYSSAGGTESNAYTNNEIDISGYSTLYIHYNRTRCYHNYLGASYADKIEFRTAPTSVPAHWFSGDTTKSVLLSNAELGDIIDSVDISEFENGRIQFRNWDSDDYIYEVWLEK